MKNGKKETHRVELERGRGMRQEQGKEREGEIHISTLVGELLELESELTTTNE